VITKKDVLQDVNFGDSVAEQEADNLQRYFVSTEQWRKVFTGATDVVYGPKGSGKSAIYSLLQQQETQLSKRNTTFITAENPRGATAFQDLVTNPPATDVQFVRMWKLYFLSLVGGFLLDATANEDAHFVVSHLQEAGLVEKNRSLTDMASAAWRYVRSFFQWESAQGEVKLDPITGMPVGVSGKITFGTFKPELAKAGVTSVDTLLVRANAALHAMNRHIWVGIDRLDVAFPDNEDLEANALRALFKVYLDFQAYPRIVPKIFLRTDIWDRISEQGFREASHITRTLTITWSKDLLLNLLMRRALQSSQLCSFYSIDADRVLEDLASQRQEFERMLPPQIDPGQRRPKALDWILSRVRDGKGYEAPRELIQLFNAAREAQLRSMEIGEQPDGDPILTGEAFKQGLKSVSHRRLYQTLYAEYPALKPYIEKLRGEKSEHTSSTLEAIWGLDESATASMIEKLINVGFFESRGDKGGITYWVPFLYRDALQLLMGKSE
jgi:hypothetical protein